MDGARTGLTSLCVTCAVRLPRTTSRCPTCSGVVVNLRDAVARDAALRQLTTLVTSASLLSPARVGAFAFLAAMGWLVWASFGPSQHVDFFTMVIAGAIILGLGAALLGFGRTRGEAPTPPSAERRRILLGTQPATSTAGTRVEGVVRRRETTLASPLDGTPCVAFRVRGQTAGADVDDAALVAFDVETDDGEHVEVPDGEATVALETGEPAPVGVPETLRRFLVERGAADTGGRVEGLFADAALRDGDRVVVEGMVEERSAGGDGYRTTRTRRVLVESADVVRVIRRA